MTHPDFTVQYKTHKRSRNIKITVKGNQLVTVTSPPFTPRFFINKFVNKNQDWIKQKLAELKTKSASQTISDELVWLFGKKYAQKISFQTDQPIGVHLEGDHLIINPISQTSAKNQVSRFLKSTASHYIPERTRVLAEKMQVKYKNVWLKQQSTRWGSCSSKLNLNFNWRLIHFEPKIIDYVIIHELAHLEHMNHSKQFWSLVRKFDPEYLKHKGFLKRQGGMEEI